MKGKLGLPLLAVAVLCAQVFQAAQVTTAAETGSSGPATGQAIDVFDHTEETYFDIRSAASAVFPDDSRLDAAKQVVDTAGAGTRITWNTEFGTPAMIMKDKGYLTEPASGEPAELARQWITNNSALYGLSKEEISSLKVIKEFKMPGTGMHPVTFQQIVDGIESAYGGRLIVTVTKDGRIASVSGNINPDGGTGFSEGFRLSAADALKNVLAEYKPDVSIDMLAALKDEAGWKVFDGGNVLPAEQRVKKAAFFTSNEIRPAFRVLFIEELNKASEVIIDGATGEKLLERPLVQYLFDPEGLVFENYPGAEKGGHQTVKSFNGDPQASPEGWLLPGLDTGFTTIGNNADTYANWSNFLVPEGSGLIRPVDAFGKFKYNFKNEWQNTNGATVPPSYAEDVHSATTNLFYQHNLFHDYFYKLGWTESAGNLQVSNFGKGGMEGDPILGLVQAGAASGGDPTYTGRDNAYMLTLPDGIPGWSGMFLWEPIAGAFEGEYADGDYDAGIIYHEYSHALSQRMVAGGESLNSHQAGSMGEAWGDWFAMHYLVKNGLQDRPIVGAYVTGNDDRGIRNWALDDSPLGFGDIGYDLIGPEVHADGEIWAAILWHMRTALINSFGASEGEKTAEHLVMDAMPISAPNPSMVDMRNAILAADMIRYNGKHYETLWKAFAQRGLGQSAFSEGGDDTDPKPAYDHPNDKYNSMFAGKLVNAATNKPIEGARIIVGQYEARTSAATVTSKNGMFALPMTEGEYDITIQARGYGATTLENMSFTSGKKKQMRISLEPNAASVFNGAAIHGMSSESESNPVKNLIDDTEASVYATAKQEEAFTGSEVTVELAGDKPVSLSHIQVSAFKDVEKGRFQTLKDFTIEASVDGETWNKVLEGGFTAAKPRPGSPDLHYQKFELDQPVNAKYLKLIAHNAQDDSGGYVQIAELQAFAAGKTKMEPLTLEPEEPFTAEGTIKAGNPGTGIGLIAGVDDASLGVTQTEFTGTQNPEPASQGTDGYVVTLPDGFGDGIHNLKVAGPGNGSYDFDIFFYNSSFEYIGSIATTAADESGVIPGGTRYVYVGLYSGNNINFTLTASAPY